MLGQVPREEEGDDPAQHDLRDSHHPEPLVCCHSLPGLSPRTIKDHPSNNRYPSAFLFHPEPVIKMNSDLRSLKC